MATKVAPAASARKRSLSAMAAEISARDKKLASFIERAGKPDIRAGVGDHYAALVRSIMFQQLAGRAAAAIHARLVETAGGTIAPQTVLALSPEQLRKAGLSGSKAASIRDLAEHVVDGRLPLQGIEQYDDETIITMLSDVRGIGRWTAEMFLLFELRRPDVWPVGDYGVRQGYALIFGGALPSPKELQPLGDRFRPYRSLVAWYCWQAVHLSRGEV